MNYYKSVLKKYAVFEGRAGRAEYWYFALFNAIIAIVLWLINSVIGDEKDTLGLLYGLAVFIPSLAVAVRRLHDTGKSAWMLLINLIPFIGFIWFLVLLIKDSDIGDNKYGPNPKQTIVL